MSAESPPPRQSPKRQRALGFALALIAVAVDQAHKLYMLRVVDIERTQPIVLAPFFELIMVWNEGISYGLFQQESDFGRYALVALAVVAAAALSVWIWQTPSRLIAVSAALIAGGAIGNGIDRAVYGAVADFFHFHVGRFSWYVFNIADVFIVLGVIGLLIDQLFGSRQPQNRHNLQD